jgi:hypothetical protein
VAAVAFALVVVGQARLALASLGGWGGATDGRPVVSGRHPLHVVHGSLGARSLRDRGTTSCYDSSFQSGYVKTPVFDAGCRPAEFVLVLLSFVDRDPSPEREIAACKLGLVGVWLLVPFAFALSAYGAGASVTSSVLSAMAGCLLWGTPAVATMLRDGEIDLLLGGLCGVGFCGGLAGYHRAPGPTAWLVLAGLTIAGWYAHPLVCLAFFPFAAAYYGSLAPRHGLAWHLGFFGAGIIGFGANASWLWDWGRYWWLRRPTTDALALPRPEELAVAGGFSEWPVDGLLSWPVLVAGALGMIAMMRLRARTPAWLFGASAVATLAIARFGNAWPILADVHIERTAILAIGLAIVPAAFGLGAWLDRARIGSALLLLLAALPLMASLGLRGPALPYIVDPLPMGLTVPQQEFVDLLKAKTTPTARIFLEDDIHDRLPGWNWTAFLPRLTGRAYIGGLDFGAAIEGMNCPMKARMRDRGEFGPADAEAVIERYNIGWVVCRTAESAARWRSFAGARETARVGELVLIAFDRTHRFVTRGTGQLDQADAKRIVLSNLVPDASGTVAVSLHYQPGMRILPASIAIEPEPDPFDATPMIRLRLPGPISRATIVWENR